MRAHEIIIEKQITYDDLDDSEIEEVRVPIRRYTIQVPKSDRAYFLLDKDKNFDKKPSSNNRSARTEPLDYYFITDLETKTREKWNIENNEYATLPIEMIKDRKALVLSILRHYGGILKALITSPAYWAPIVDDEKIFTEAIKINPGIILSMSDPTLEQQLLAINTRPSLIKHTSKLEPEAQLAAVKRSPYLIKYVAPQDQTPEIKALAKEYNERHQGMMRDT